ncbi:MAG: stage II sporulation protein P [Eubacteriales bacterium]|nr:stage II sporulation protein P [Eubacteriales bacterium]
MTKFQKAVSVCMSLCFFMILAVLPGQFFFRENVYRQLPLYCFLEERAASAPPAQDWETYEKIVAANGAYLGKKIRQEQLRAKRLREAEESRDEKEQEPEEKQEPEASLAEDPGLETAALPHPVIDLSPERLSDSDYLLNQFFVEDSATEAVPGLLNAARFLEKDLTIKQDASAPQILIYHSHASETFADSREGRQGDTIVGVGSCLARILKEKYGYHVIHIKDAFDMAGGTLDRSKAYDYAGEFLTSFLEKNPSIEVILDVHRDGVPEDRRLVTEINGKKTAQIMFYNGISYTKEQGNVDYLPNPYIEDNLAFSFQMEYQAAQYYPDFYRCIYLAGYRYNLHLRPKSMLLEVGAQNNTVQEAKNAMEPFAELLDKVLQG